MMQSLRVVIRFLCIMSEPTLVVSNMAQNLTRVEIVMNASHLKLGAVCLLYVSIFFLDEVIKAWEMVIPTMKLGEVCELVAGPEYAYMDGKTLHFEIEMLEFFGTDISRERDGTIRQSIIEKGDGISNPASGVRVEAHIKGSFNGKVFDERDISFLSGDIDSVEIPQGVDTALACMSKGEKSIIRISGQNSVSDKLGLKFGLQAGSKLEYEVVLKSFEQVCFFCQKNISLATTVN